VPYAGARYGSQALKPQTKAKVVRRFQKYALNPFSRLVAGYIGPSLLETKGRKSGRARRVPVGTTSRDGAFWIVSEHGRRSDYVRNIEADPHVRIKRGARWHDGVAHIVPDEDPRDHLGGVNGLFVRMAGSDLLTIRIDLKS
jgi:deazaflavin-dependent oxidoreductase (nitroreductase family)